MGRKDDALWGAALRTTRSKGRAVRLRGRVCVPEAPADPVQARLALAVAREWCPAGRKLAAMRTCLDALSGRVSDGVR